MIPRRYLPLLVLFFAATTLPAQTDFKRLVYSLSTTDQQRLNTYLQRLGASRERQLGQAYDLLGADARSRAERYAAFLAAPPAERPRTQVTWNRDTLQLGRIDEGTIVLDSFTVRNTGSAPYVISRTHASCDCTVLSAPDYPIMPGESATIRIEFNSTGKVGRTVPGIILYDNSSPNLRSILYVNTYVVSRKRGG